jgi:hypothetical protein
MALYTTFGWRAKERIAAEDSDEVGRQYRSACGCWLCHGALSPMLEVVVLPLFPALLPDEPLYSGIARYGDQMQLASRLRLSDTTLGRAVVTPVVDLPGHIQAFVERVPAALRLTAAQVIAEHTALPYYAAFLPNDNVASVAHAMAHTHARVATRSVGRALNIIDPLVFQYCPECVAQDLAATGVPYWRRVQQLAGVIVCPEHEVPLWQTGVGRWGQGGSRRFQSLQSALATSPGHPVAVTDIGLASYVAAASAWLLGNGMTTTLNEARTAHSVADRYDALFARRGFRDLTFGKRLRKPLTEFLTRRIDADAIRGLFMYRDADAARPDLARASRLTAGRARGTESVMRRFVAREDSSHQHPLVHLLVLRAFGVSASDFLTGTLSGVERDGRNGLDGCADVRVVPDSSRMCLNPLCKQYAVSRHARDAWVLEWAGRRAAVTGTCDRCGFGFTLRSSATGKHQLSVSTTGPVWDACLRRLLDDRVSAKRMSPVLGVSETTLKVQIVRLGWWPPHWTAASRARIQRIIDEAQARRAASARHTEAELLRRRSIVLALRAAHPTESRYQLRVRDHATWLYLFENDPAWLEAHLPPRRRTYGRRLQTVDWAAHDATVLPRARDAVARIRSREGRLARVTLHHIATELMLISVFRRDLPSMPLTQAFTESVIETVDDFAARRAVCAARQMAAEGATGTLYDIVARASLSMIHRQRLRPLCDALLAWLAQHASDGRAMPREWARMIAAAPWEEPDGALHEFRWSRVGWSDGYARGSLAHEARI